MKAVEGKLGFLKVRYFPKMAVDPFLDPMGGTRGPTQLVTGTAAT